MMPFVAWVAFPLVLAALSLGCGLFVEWVAGVELDPMLLPALGIATVIVVVELATATRATATIATPAVVGIAVAGVVARPHFRRRIAGAAAIAATAVFGMFAAPVVLSGNLTVPGWIKLDDTATWLALTDRVMQHARDVHGLPPSTYELVLAHNFASGYPLGAFLPLGVGGRLVGVDLAWLFQPYQAFLAAVLALTTYALVSRVIASRVLCGSIAFLASQSALYYGYALWGGVKEVAAAPLIALVAAVVASLQAGGLRIRPTLLLAVATAATVAALSVGGFVWLLPAVASAGVFAWRAGGARFAVRAGAAYAAASLALSVPTIAISRAFVDASGPVTANGELGNLLRPLRFVQIMGIWPVGDFRVDPGHLNQTYVLVAVAVVAASFGVFVALRRGAVGLTLYVACGVFGAVVLFVAGSPWVGAKSLATATPALAAAALTGSAALIERRRRVEGAVVLAAIAGGIVWSNVLQYHDVDLAPHAQLAELGAIGARFAGDGPTLMMEYSPYGTRHFLRALAPESAGEYRSRLVPLRGGGEVPKGGYADIDQVQLPAVLAYRTLVLNRSPSASRPPLVYKRIWRGSFYEVWQRSVSPTVRVADHLSLGAGDQAVAVPACSDVIRMGVEAARAHAVLAAVVRAPAVVAPLSTAKLSAGWRTDPQQPDVVFPPRDGVAAVTVAVPRSGLYSVWLGGSFRRRLDVVVDGHRIWHGRNELNHPGVFTPVGRIRLGRGRHSIILLYSRANVFPGSGGGESGFGPVALEREDSAPVIRLVRPAEARSLCRRSLDWIEVVSGLSP